MTENRHLGRVTLSRLAFERARRLVSAQIIALTYLSCFIVLANVSVDAQPAGLPEGYFSGISKVELEYLISDVAKSNPNLVEQLAQDAGKRKAQLENLRHILAFAAQAQRDGMASNQTTRQELDSIRNEVVAVNYDKEINKDKPPMPPFGYITDAQVSAFWNANPRHEEEFAAFLDAKVLLLKAGDPEMKDRVISADERSQARETFAKIRIYKGEYDTKLKSGVLPQLFGDKVDLQVRLQRAQFLSRLFSEKVGEKVRATDGDIAKYISDHPELDPAAKRAKAQSILNRAKAGEDFAKLANEFTEDPGNTGPDGAKQGGIYTAISKGQMVAPFENAALALDAGQISPDLVETDFGFHILKLEKKSAQLYDARHILISTSIPDPNDPVARPQPVKEYAREKIESQREKQYLDQIAAENNIQVPADFEVPKLSAVAEPKAVKKPVSKKRPVKKRK